MSWPGEEWKVGLPPPALRAIAEVEQRLERVQKERQQKQVQLDTLEALMHKQRQKHEEEKASWALLSQENRSLAEACEQADRARQRLAQELQAKEAQLSCLEAQLAQATRRQAELEDELRRCQVELEKLQSESHPVFLPPRRGSPTLPWAEGAGDAKTDNSRTPAAGTAKMECNSPPVGDPCVKDMPSEDAAFPGGPREGPDPTGKDDRAQSGASELASTGEKLKADNQELRLALAQAESRLQEKEQELWRLQGHVEVTRLELAQWKKQRGRGDVAEPSGTQDGQGRRLSEDVGRLHRSREQEKGLAGTERISSGSTRRSVSSSRLEQLAEKRGSATRQKGLAFQSPKVPSAERSPEELQALRLEVLTLRRRLEASESQRKNLLETCWQQQRTRAWVQERQMPLLGVRVASWQRKKEASRHQTGKKPQALEGREVTGKRGELGSGEEVALEAQTEPQGPEEDEPEMGTPNTPAERTKEETPCVAKAEDPNQDQDLNQDEAHGEGEPREATEAWHETIRTLAAGKAEAEAQARLAQQKLQTLQATLGLQTERLAQALEAQSRHVEELVANAEEKERLVDSLRRELEDTKNALDAARGEKQSLRVLLEQKEEELHHISSKAAPGLPRNGEATLAQGDKAGMAHNGLAAHAQKEGHEQAELETFLAQLLRENQALRHELIHWEAMIVGKGDLDSCSISSTLHGEATAANVLQASQKVALLIQESHRDVQTQTDGPEAGVQHRRRERVSVAFDDTQYEPYGLPEVVMKGFADIPSGPSCPYVLRRGILGSAPVAQLAPKAEPEEDGLEAEEGAGV